MYLKIIPFVIAIFIISVAPIAMSNEIQQINYGEKPIFELNFLNIADSVQSATEDAPAMTWELPDDLKKAIPLGANYWSTILGQGAKNPEAIRVNIRTEDEKLAEGVKPPTGNGFPSNNASANFDSFINGEESLLELSRLSIQNGMKIGTSNLNGSPVMTGNVSYFNINIGKYLAPDDSSVPNAFGWYINDGTLIPENEGAADYVGAMRHELGHALGILTNSEKEEKEGENIFRFCDDYSPNAFALHLVDETGQKMRPKKIIADPSEVDHILDLIKKNPSEELKNITKDDFFLLSKNKEEGKTTGQAYFVGENVSQVLDGALFDGVNGLPVNGWEGEEPELSHIQTQGMMSHVPYSNFTSFLEAELALMQDIGYSIDRKNFYGYSVYKNDASIINKNGYSARNAEGTAYLPDVYNETPLGIGLHIYGSRNNVTQAADILTKGRGAAGIRVDGSENTLTIPENVSVHSDGDSGIGLLVSYGRNQRINMAGILSAQGRDGVGIRLDFGNSSNGAADEYRGSMIQYIRESPIYIADSNAIRKIKSGENKSFDEMNGELKGALVKDLNITGALIGGKNAIYIGKNAFVENINIKSGARIVGNITSDWLNFNEETYPSLQIVTENESIDYNKYIPQFTTNLNISGNAEYGGNITGSKNMRLNVAQGKFIYRGLADIVNVTVDKGAELYGGSYKVNYFSPEETAGQGTGYGESGVFLNRGNISLAAGDIHISGNKAGGNPIFISEGTISGFITNDGLTSGTIRVAGEARLNNSRLMLYNAVAGERAILVESENQQQKDAYIPMANEGRNNAIPISGLLSVYSISQNGKYEAVAEARNNGAARNGVQLRAFGAMQNMAEKLSTRGDSRRNEMRLLYNLDAGRAGEALSEIGANDIALASAISLQRSMLIYNAVRSRADTFGRLSEYNQEKGTGIWLKGFSNLAGHREHINRRTWSAAGGYDIRIFNNKYIGLLMSYSASTLKGRTSDASVRDTRAGIYTGWNGELSSFFLYAGMGSIRTNTHRNLDYLGLRASGEYDSWIAEINGEYRYDTGSFTRFDIHIIPYVSMQLSHLYQNKYKEKGAGVYSQESDFFRNTFVSSGAGAEIRRFFERGSLGFRLGVRHAFIGGEPEMRVAFSGNSDNFINLTCKQDKTFGTAGIFSDAYLGAGVSLKGDVEIQQGRYEYDALFRISLSYDW